MKSTWFKLIYVCTHNHFASKKIRAHFHKNIVRPGFCCNLSRNLKGQVASISQNVFFVQDLSWNEHLIFLIFSSTCIPTFLSKMGLKPVLRLNRNSLAAELTAILAWRQGLLLQQHCVP